MLCYAVLCRAVLCHAVCLLRYDVLQEMLEVLRDHQNNEHMSRLEWIVIILIALAVSDAWGCGGVGLGLGCRAGCLQAPKSPERELGRGTVLSVVP